MAANQDDQLSRELGVPGASLLGLGSILGTGVFVSIGLAAGVAGPSVIIAVGIAALVATANGLSSAQLAAAHPVSGGTYEYAYRVVHPSAGFAAGWMFLVAKSASAATAALGLIGYALHAFDIDGDHLEVPLAFAAVVLVGALVVGGLRRSNRANAIVVAITVAALVAFVVGALSAAKENFSTHVTFESLEISELLEAAALMFVAFAGYGRVATLGEEVARPRITIPRAIVATLVASAVLYISVAIVAVAAVGATALAAATNASAAPLEIIAASLGHDIIARIIAIGAITAMLGVTLNLILGLSRVALAMGRRGDLPSGLAKISGNSPRRAVIFVTAIIAGLTLIGDIGITWSLAAFTVLLYYSLTNISALRLPEEHRFLPQWISAAGLVGCLGLAFWVSPKVLLSGLAVLVAGFVWRTLFRRFAGKSPGGA